MSEANGEAVIINLLSFLLWCMFYFLKLYLTVSVSDNF